MKTVTLSALLALAAFFAAPAVGQEIGPVPASPDPYPPIQSGTPDPGWDGDAWRRTGYEYFGAMDDGLIALKLGNFTKAEASFARVLKRDADNADANLFIGVARMKLGKWEAARPSLEIARAGLPAHPDPASRLGVTYAMLGDTDGARAQRADLVRMAAACTADCELAPYIRNGIAMIDEALGMSH